jgi:hypothetical protein
VAKQYTQAAWARIQSRLPEEDRVPYAESPEKFDTSADVRARIQGFAQRIEPGVTEEEFPTSNYSTWYSNFRFLNNRFRAKALLQLFYWRVCR